MGLVLSVKEVPSEMRQKCAEHLWGGTPFGRYQISLIGAFPSLMGCFLDLNGLFSDLNWAVSAYALMRHFPLENYFNTPDNTVTAH